VGFTELLPPYCQVATKQVTPPRPLSSRWRHYTWRRRLCLTGATRRDSRAAPRSDPAGI